MNAFIVLCALMVVALLVWIVLPMVWKRGGEADSTGERRVSSIVLVFTLPLLAIFMYTQLSNWDWNAEETQVSQAAEMEQMLSQLEARMASQPEDVEGWLMLGRSYMTLQRFDRATAAFQQAYDHSEGNNLDAVIGLGESLALSDENALAGRAGELFESALAVSPEHPKALWYGSVAALRSGKLALGRDRLKALLAQNPPEQFRAVLAQQIRELDAELGDAPAAAAAGEQTPPASSSQQRTIRVSVSIAPQLREQAGDAPLFVLARAPGGGPPVAVKRSTANQLPMTLELTEGDAMIPSHTLANFSQVQVVARISRSGAPQASSGDLYGEADYDFDKDGGVLNIIIDQLVP